MCITQQDNRITKVDYPTDVDVLYSYDNPVKGTLSSVSGGFGTVSYQFNRRLQPVREDYSADGRSWVKSYAYGSLNLVYVTQYPDGGVNHVYFNDQGLLRQVPRVVNNFAYDAFGRVTQKNYANRLKTVSKAGSVVEEYTYDSNGNRFKKVSCGETM